MRVPRVQGLSLFTINDKPVSTKFNIEHEDRRCCPDFHLGSEAEAAFKHHQECPDWFRLKVG